jgi:small basic protein (TIGR04137 family)
VQDVLKEQFAGRPVTEQNLSDWKQGGYQDWLRHEESYQLITDLTEQQESLAAAADGAEISDRFATLLSAELVALTRKLLEEKTDLKERWQCLREVLRELDRIIEDLNRILLRFDELPGSHSTLNSNFSHLRAVSFIPIKPVAIAPKLAILFARFYFKFNQNLFMSQHSSLRAAAKLGGKRNVLKRYERVELLKKRGQWKDGNRITGLRKTKPDA